MMQSWFYINCVVDGLEAYHGPLLSCHAILHGISHNRCQNWPSNTTALWKRFFCGLAHFSEIQPNTNNVNGWSANNSVIFWSNSKWYCRNVWNFLWCYGSSGYKCSYIQLYILSLTFVHINRRRTGRRRCFCSNLHSDPSLSAKICSRIISGHHIWRIHCQFDHEPKEKSSNEASSATDRLLNIAHIWTDAPGWHNSRRSIQCHVSRYTHPHLTGGSLILRRHSNDKKRRSIMEKRDNRTQNSTKNWGVQSGQNNDWNGGSFKS